MINKILKQPLNRLRGKLLTQVVLLFDHKRLFYTGDNGAIGPIGPRGQMGDAGLPGLRGSPGDQGYPGKPGWGGFLSFVLLCILLFIFTTCTRITQCWGSSEINVVIDINLILYQQDLINKQMSLYRNNDLIATWW